MLHQITEIESHFEKMLPFKAQIPNTNRKCTESWSFKLSNKDLSMFVAPVALDLGAGNLL